MRAIRLALILASFLLVLSKAKIINVTVDDYFGDPTNGQKIQYFPDTAWQSGNGCQPCTAKPTPASDAWMGTWHDATFNPNDTATNLALGQIISASVQFTGTAVYVNCILTRSFTSPDGNSDMTFFLDDDNNPAGVFQQSPNGDTTYHFDVAVFFQTDLPFGQHTVRLEAGHAGQKALVLLDSIVYTTDDGLGGDNLSSSSTSSAVSTSSAAAAEQTGSGKTSNVGLIVGPIVAAMILVIGLIVSLLLYLRRRRSRDTAGNYGAVINPFRDDSRVMSQTENFAPQNSSVVGASEPSASSAVAMVSSPTKKKRGNPRTFNPRRTPRPLPTAPSWPDSSRSS